jgi:rhodanese-related sulfurtransferase
VQRRIFSNINPAVVVLIIILSSATAFVYNYFNPEGLNIISLPSKEDAVIQTGEIKFFQPVAVDSEDAFILFDNAVQFIDVRSPEEYGEGHIPGSVNIPRQDLADARKKLSAFTQDTPLVIYSSSGSGEEIEQTSEHLFSEGFNRIYIYRDGYEDWLRSNYPVIR